MTFHIDQKHHTCEVCKAMLFPFKKDFYCPNCNKKINDYVDIIPLLYNSLICNKKEYGCFNPPVWYRSTLVSYIQSILSDIFDYLSGDRQSASNDLKLLSIVDKEYGILLIREYFEKKINWYDYQIYLKIHIREIALEIYPMIRMAYISEEIKPFLKRRAS